MRFRECAMGEKDKRRYAYGGFLPAVNLCIQPDSNLICDDLVEELATIPTSMLKQKMRNIDNLLSHLRFSMERLEHLM